MNKITMTLAPLYDAVAESGKPLQTITLTLMGYVVQGQPGEGLPAGGTTGQVPTKKSEADFDIEWQDPAAGATPITVGATPLSGHTVVTQDASGLLVYADSTKPVHTGAALGLLAAAYPAGAAAVVQTGYDIEHSGWAWAPGPVFLGANGALTQAPASGAVFSQVIGWAVSAARIRIDIQPPVILS